MRPDLRAVPLGLALVLLLFGCAPGAAGGGGGGRDSNLLTLAELEQVANFSAYEAIERLRPQWLRSRGASSVMYADDNLPAAMVDNARTGLEALRTLRASEVREMRFIDGRDATTRYGTGFVNGLIEVRTRTGPS